MITLLFPQQRTLRFANETYKYAMFLLDAIVYLNKRNSVVKIGMWTLTIYNSIFKDFIFTSRMQLINVNNDGF